MTGSYKPLHTVPSKISTDFQLLRERLLPAVPTVVIAKIVVVWFGLVHCWHLVERMFSMLVLYAEEAPDRVRRRRMYKESRKLGNQASS